MCINFNVFPFAVGVISSKTYNLQRIQALYAPIFHRLFYYFCICTADRLFFKCPQCTVKCLPLPPFFTGGRRQHLTFGYDSPASRLYHRTCRGSPQLYDGDAVLPLAVAAQTEGLYGAVAAEDLVDTLAQGAGTLAVDDAHGI